MVKDDIPKRSDSDASSKNSASVIARPSAGGLVLNPTGSFTYSPMLFKEECFAFKEKRAFVSVIITYTDLGLVSKVELEKAVTVMVKKPELGKVTLYNDGSFSYTSIKVGNDHFSYQLKDSTGHIKQAVVSLGVVPQTGLSDRASENDMLTKAVEAAKKTSQRVTQIVVKHSLENGVTPNVYIEDPNKEPAKEASHTVAALAISLDDTEVPENDSLPHPSKESKESIALKALKNPKSEG